MASVPQPARLAALYRDRRSQARNDVLLAAIFGGLASFGLGKLIGDTMFKPQQMDGVPVPVPRAGGLLLKMTRGNKVALLLALAGSGAAAAYVSLDLAPALDTGVLSSNGVPPAVVTAAGRGDVETLTRWAANEGRATVKGPGSPQLT